MKNPTIKNCKMYISDESRDNKIVIKGKHLKLQWVDHILIVYPPKK